ncbi:DUF2785 domain-containing protein [Krasilnikovia sp. MM14-A1259]|uniref:DUF2785 domain-containing protein n=1 Tax=Krasilnikovia sp. MM14-A1259 TaxID=3373539 RepID=UPI0037FB31AE
MINWAELVATDFPVPDQLEAALGELSTMLAAVDPVARDAWAYPTLATWIERGVLDDHLTDLGAAMVARFNHPEVQARTFAPLVLASAVRRDAVAGVLTDTTVLGWRDAFVSWWPAEADIRGWDEQRGWLHAVAHGADLAGELGASPRLTTNDRAELLTVVGRRVVAPTDYRYAHMEEDRVAGAITQILATEALPVAPATGWLTTVDDLFATVTPGPLSVPVANTLAVLRAAYVMADRSALPDRTSVTDAIAQRLHLAFGGYPLLRQ